MNKAIRVVKEVLKRERALYRKSHPKGGDREWVREINSLVRTINLLREYEGRAEAIEIIKTKSS